MRLALAVIALTACEQAPATSAASDHEASCLADSVHLDVLNWHPNEDCTASNLHCRDLCTAGDADACFSRAIAIERSPDAEDEARKLFERSCTLGLANGCTNWASTVWAMHDDPPVRCLLRTFEKTCNFGDPFGCGMVGRFLVKYRVGFGPLPRARIELETTCARLEGFPCRILAAYGERGVFERMSRARIVELMKRACDGGDDNACGEHATVEETFE